MQVEAESWVWADDAHDVIDTPEVGPVKEVEPFRYELEVGMLAYFVPPAQACIEVHVIRTNTGVAAGSRRAVRGGVVVVSSALL